MNIKGQGLYLTLDKGHSDLKIKACFLRDYWVILNRISYESLWVNGNENLYKWVGSHDQDGCHAHIWLKPLQIFFSRTNWRMALEFCM